MNAPKGASGYSRKDLSTMLEMTTGGGVTLGMTKRAEYRRYWRHWGLPRAWGYKPFKKKRAGRV